jgi:hypothetical protein
MTVNTKKIQLQKLNTILNKELENIDEDILKKNWESSRESTEEIISFELYLEICYQVKECLKKKVESLQEIIALEIFNIKSKNLKPGPKRNKSAYMFFCQDTRKKIVEENPDCKPHQIMSLLGSKWRELTTKQKSKYYEQAAEDKERYLDMKELEKRRNKTPNKLSSYFLFCEDERPLIKKEYPNMKTKKVTAECGKRWNELKLNDSDRYKLYVEKASK